MKKLWCTVSVISNTALCTLANAGLLMILTATGLLVQTIIDVSLNVVLLINEFFSPVMSQATTMSAIRRLVCCCRSLPVMTVTVRELAASRP